MHGAPSQDNAEAQGGQILLQGGNHSQQPGGTTTAADEPNKVDEELALQNMAQNF